MDHMPSFTTEQTEAVPGGIRPRPRSGRSRRTTKSARKEAAENQQRRHDPERPKEEAAREGSRRPRLLDGGFEVCSGRALLTDVNLGDGISGGSWRGRSGRSRLAFQCSR